MKLAKRLSNKSTNQDGTRSGRCAVVLFLGGVRHVGQQRIGDFLNRGLRVDLDGQTQRLLVHVAHVHASLMVEEDHVPVSLRVHANVSFLVLLKNASYSLYIKHKNHEVKLHLCAR